jgi:hypothetical protein
MERWCPTQQVLGVFLKKGNPVKKLLFVCAISLAELTIASALGARPASAQASFFGPGPAGDGFPHPNYNRSPDFAHMCKVTKQRFWCARAKQVTVQRKVRVK